LSLISIIALLAAGAALLFLASRRKNPVAAFVIGIVVSIVVAIALAIPFENMASSMGGTETALFGALAVLLVAAVGAGFVAMRIFVPTRAASTQAQQPAAPGPAPARPQAAKANAPPSGPPPDVFISYKRDERPEVLAIARRLEALKLRVWFDAEMRSGTTFDSEIDRQIRSASVVLVCWSPGAIASDWVRGEATIGRQRNVLAAAFLKPCDLPAPFNLVHADDLTAGARPSNPEWLKVVERIGMLTGRPGLAAFEALELAPDKSAYAAWIAGNSSDPLVDVAVSRLKAGSA
jgi:hypothetical protein